MPDHQVRHNRTQLILHRTLQACILFEVPLKLATITLAEHFIIWMGDKNQISCNNVPKHCEMMGLTMHWPQTSYNHRLSDLDLNRKSVAQP